MKILVYGFYHKNNIGDQLFIKAFEKLFPNYIFLFTDKITTELLKEYNIIFFGGGSFLDGDPKFSSEIISLLLEKSIFYIGVGTETDIHQTHQILMKSAKLIASRSFDISKAISLNSNTIQIPDIVYSLHQAKTKTKINKILFIPNSIVVPNYSSQHWTHAAWGYFKSEFCQTLDELSNSYKIDFLSMCENNKNNDTHAGIEINNFCLKKYKIISTNEENIIEIIKQYDLIITQRFHGIVLANMCNIPVISIHHHSKLEKTYPKTNFSISYYELNKNKLLSIIDNIKYDNLPAFNVEEPIQKLQDLVNKVRNLLETDL